MFGKKKKEKTRGLKLPEEYKAKSPAVLYLTAFTFVVMAAATALIYGLWCLADALDWLNITLVNLRIVILNLFLASLVISSVTIRVFGNRFIYGSVRALGEASRQVATGDFSVQLPIPREREMGELTKNFNDMVVQLGRQEMLANDFISNVSHEFRNPLSAIRGYAQLLDSDALTKEQRQEYFQVIEEKAVSLSSLVSDILKLSRLENQGKGPAREEFSLDEQIRRCVLISQQRWEQKNLTMDVSLAPASYFGSKELLSEVWGNLIDNAVKFTPAGGNVSVTLSDAGTFVVVSVSDTGAGMDPETQERIFDKFYQGSQAKSGEGNGLGLAIVQKIVSLHDGKIEVKSMPGKGTTFRVTLPRLGKA